MTDPQTRTGDPDYMSGQERMKDAMFARAIIVGAADFDTTRNVDRALSLSAMARAANEVLEELKPDPLMDRQTTVRGIVFRADRTLEALDALSAFGPMPRYNAALKSAEIAYKTLTLRQALAVSPRTPLYFAIISLGTLAGRSSNLIGSALAEAAKSERPLGLSQTSFDIIALILASTVAILFVGLFWAGYVAKFKNRAAAHVVQHMVTFLSGALLGLKT